ncbi:hypothetical protein BLNAU_23750 [Blattamonas nauphoetae]|uniref:Uncharacterized protein n=1 Tax=Blattamonas nauphoetae TaxID=2049346 RepID=A0ABQ9WPC2_9EUKA|nr:hypothetical protein BLNAU_23750 [Blattamonas nauphoetae]
MRQTLFNEYIANCATVIDRSGQRDTWNDASLARLTLPIASAGMRAFTHTRALSSILSFFCLSLFNILGESRFFEDADTKSTWSMFIQSQSNQLLSRVEKSLANNTSNLSTPNSQFVPPSLSYISTLIPPSTSQATRLPAAPYQTSLHSLLSILIRTMSKPTTHRLADICGQLLLQRLVHVILQLVSAISKPVSKALEDEVKSELDEGEEAAGILSSISSSATSSPFVLTFLTSFA